jgi:hypothetical protein
MDASAATRLTPEQIAALEAGQGIARCVDPASGRVYYLIEQTGPPALNDDYVREKVNEAYAKGDCARLDRAAVKAQFARRTAAAN